jgi:hypothetical protein
LDAQTNWVAMSGDGLGGYRTNVLPAVTTPDANGYYQVTIMSDYTLKTYSLSVNNSCIGTNLPFICNPTEGGADRWFVAQNLAGSTRCFLDEYRVSTNITGILTNTIPGGGLSDYDALAYFNTPAPRPVATNATIIGDNVAWKFKVDGEGTNFVLGGTTTSNITTPIGILSANGQITNIVGASKYFYKIVRRSSSDPTVAVTNSEVYAAYKQDRAQRVSYIVGAPVDVLDGDRTLGGTLGRQLASGLSTNDRIRVYIGGTSHDYTLQSDGTWAGLPLPAEVTISPGQAVIVARLTNGPATTSTIIAGTVPTNTIESISLSVGKNAVAWPYESSGGLGAFSGLTPRSDFVLGDYILIQTNTAQVTIGYFDVGGWMTGVKPGRGTNLNVTLQAGAGMIIYNTQAGSTWAPQ